MRVNKGAVILNFGAMAVLAGLLINTQIQLDRQEQLSKDILQITTATEMQISHISKSTQADSELKEYYLCLGQFEITHYCLNCDVCDTTDITKSGTVATPGKTIAVDPDVIPLGTKVLINGVEYIAEDTGGKIKGNKIDICVSSHEEAVRLGTYTAFVFKTIYE